MASPTICQAYLCAPCLLNGFSFDRSRMGMAIMSQDRTESGRTEDFTDGKVPFRIILAMQGGGALGAYHGGVYQALHESGLEPDWIIGTSIGAISGANISGNPPDERLSRLAAFWESIVPPHPPGWNLLPASARRQAAKHMALTMGVPGFFHPNAALAFGWRVPLSLEHSALYSNVPLEKKLAELIDFDLLNSGKPRLSFGLVRVAEGTLHYCDNRKSDITLRHVLASAALPPSFPAVHIDGAAYWDAGFYDNSPLDVAFEERSGCNSIIFAPNLWPLAGAEPRSLSEAWSRQKSITFANRAGDQIARHVELHRLRHIIGRLIDMLPEDKRETLRERNLAGHASQSLIHLIQLNARIHEGGEPYDDIDFTSLALRERWVAGYADARRMIDRRPWEKPVAMVNGISVHSSDE
jgi:NTE family protein